MAGVFCRGWTDNIKFTNCLSNSNGLTISSSQIVYLIVTRDKFCREAQIVYLVVVKVLYKTSS
jgi:hypothetical protein